MNQCFSYRIHDEDSDIHNSLVIFLGQYADQNLILAELKDDVQKNLLPSFVYLITMSPNSDLLRSLEGDEDFLRDFDSFVGAPADKLMSLIVSPDGLMQKLEDDTVNLGTTPIELLHQGAVHIFKDRQGVLESGSDYHFSKPSGDHTNKFMRVSNILTSGLEVQFLAIGLLPYLNNTIKRIYVDTSSIAYLISCALQLSGKFLEKIPSIESFESYTIFNKPFDFVDDSNSLVFVSATTSGSLVKKLSEKNNFLHEQLITIFYTRLQDNQKGIFNIVDAISGEIYSDKEVNCKLCKLGSKVIHISGEQFLPETPKHKKILIRKVDFSQTRERFFQEFATKDLLQWDVNTLGTAEENEHFFIDIKTYIEDATYSQQFSDKLQKELNKHFSRDIKTVISINDQASLVLREKIKDCIDPTEEDNIEWLTIDECTEESLKEKSSVMVVIGAITSGRKLLASSRKLRSIKNSSTIKYMIGFSKLPTKESLDQLSKDLRLGGHEVIVLKNLLLPRIKEPLETTWDIERSFWNEFSQDNPFPDEGNELELPDSFKNRITVLESNQDKSNKLFLKSPNDQVLWLRDTFAFWSSLNLSTNEASQADVYWTIQTILHDLRLAKNDEGLGNTYHSTVLSPVCFDRFNDGVIQACLLRSALPVELNYSINQEFSRQMTDVLKSIIENSNNDQGEASLEFLLAIATKRLKIMDIHLQEVIDLPRGEMKEEMIFLLEYIKNTI